MSVNEPAPSRRDLLEKVSAVALGAALACSAPSEVVAQAEPDVPVVPQPHKITCDCGAVLGTSEKPQPVGGVTCDDCYKKNLAAYGKKFEADKTAVLAKIPTLTQALAVRWSTGWADLAPGVREGWQQVIDQAAVDGAK